MRKIITLLMSIIIVFSVGVTPVQAADNLVLNVSKNSSTKDISKNIYGVFMDDKSFGIDGGLVSNLVNNNSFENPYNNVNAWQSNPAGFDVSTEKPLNENNPTYAVIQVDSKGTLTNLGYTELNNDKENTADMGFKAGVNYDFSCYIYNENFDGTISVYLDSPKNKSNITQLDISASGNAWRKVSAVLESVADEEGGLTLEFNGTGTLYIDFVSLVPENSYGYGTSQWKYTTLRNDLYTALEQLNSSFIGFPTEYDSGENLYDWKNTIGPLEERVQASNYVEDNIVEDYINTMSMGTHEYLQLCADLGAEAVPVVNAPDSQDSNEWDAYVHDVLDLIEYANGDSTTTYWGALRSANGSSEPFNIKYIAVENGNFDEISKEIKDVYPEITVISTYEEPKIEDSSNTMLDAVIKASAFVESEINNNVFEMISAFAKVNAQSKDDSLIWKDDTLIWFDSQEVVLTPNYYAQMLFANNVGNKSLEADFSNGETVQNDVYSSVTIDEDSQTAYIKLVNTSGQSQNVDVNLSDFGNINNISSQSVSGKFKSACNEVGKNTTYPVQKELKAGEKVTVELDNYDVTVIRVAYGSNVGTSLYALPEFIDTMTADTQTYYPVSIKVAVPLCIFAVIFVIVVVSVVWKVVVKRKKR